MKKRKRKSDERDDEKDENTTNGNDANEKRATISSLPPPSQKLIFVPNKEQERERERIKAHLSDCRTFPTIIEKRRGRTVNVSRFSSECEEVLRALKERRRKRFVEEGVEEKRRLVLSESLIDDERDREKKTLFQFPLTTIEEDFSRQQFSTTTTKRKKLWKHNKRTPKRLLRKKAPVS